MISFAARLRAKAREIDRLERGLLAPPIEESPPVPYYDVVKVYKGVEKVIAWRLTRAESVGFVIHARHALRRLFPDGNLFEMTTFKIRGSQ